MACHFNLEDHSLEDLIVTPIESIESLASEEKTTELRRERESCWIERLDTAQPTGLNIYKGSGITPYVVQFNHTANKASKIVRSHYQTLQNDYPHVFKNNMIVAYSRNKNLNDILVSSNLKPLPE